MKVPEPPAEYLEFLKPFSAEITALALVARAMVLRAAPGCSELIYDAYNAVTSAYSYTGRLGDAFIHLPVYARWVNVGFNRGSLLKDPEGCWWEADGGSGTFRIEKAADLKAPALRRW
jgi:hypothetical protein